MSIIRRKSQKSVPKASGDVQMLLKTFCRIRPVQPFEQDEDKIIAPKTVVRIMDPDLNIDHSRKCEFDDVIGEEQSNESVFLNFGKKLCDQVLANDSVILMAYGQTGAGKTYTIIGEKEKNVIGLIPRCIDYFLKEQSIVEIAMVEVYSTNTAKIQSLDIFGDGKVIKNLKKATYYEVGFLQEATDLLEKGKKKLHIFPTGKNPTSSRGHTIYILKVDDVPLIIVDLAGSEGETAFDQDFCKRSLKKDVNRRKREASVINEGLGGLTRLIGIVAENGRESIDKARLSGANSELTRILLPRVKKCDDLYIMYMFAPTSSNSVASNNTMRFAGSIINASNMREAEVYKVKLQLTKQKLQDTQKERNQFKTELDETLTNFYRVSEEFQDAKEKYDMVFNEKESLKKENGQLAEELDELKNSIEQRIKQEVQDTIDEIGILESQGAKLAQKISALADENKKLLSVVEMKESEISEKDEAIDSLQDENKMLSHSCLPWCIWRPKDLSKKKIQV